MPNTRIDYQVVITMKPRNGLAAILRPADGRWAAVPVRGRIRNIVDFS